MHPFSAARHHVLARRDAKREAALERGIQEREPVQPRQVGELLLNVNGQTFALELRPDRRDCRRWYAFRNGNKRYRCCSCWWTRNQDRSICRDP